MNLADIVDKMTKNSRTLKKVFFGWLALVVLFDVVQPRDYAHFLIDKIFLFWSVFGAIGCFLLIKAGKGLAHLILGKKEDYYG